MLRTIVTSAAFARPADTTAYAAKDVVNNSASAPAVLTFAGAARVNGGAGYVTKGRLVTNQSTNTATFRLWLYNVAPTAINDNLPFTLLWANRAARIGYIDIGPCATEGTGSNSASAQNADARLAFQCAANVSAIYGVLETLSAFTPASEQAFLVELTLEQE